MPDVLIDIGRFKYVLLRVSDSSSGGGKLVVRGDREKAYHADIVDAVRAELQAVGLKARSSKQSQDCSWRLRADTV